MRTQRNASTRLRASDARSLVIRESAVGKTASPPPGKGPAGVPSPDVVQDGRQGQDVSEAAEPCDPAHHRVLDEGRPPERLTGGGIAEMDLDGRYRGVEQGVAYRDARVRISARIDDESLELSPRVLEGADDLAF